MDIKRTGSQPSGKGPADYFTGAVRVDLLFQAPDPARVSGASVTFEPGARTAWHTHPLGQTLIVTVGCRWVQRDVDKDFVDKTHCVGIHGLSEEDKARQLRKPHPAPSVQVG